ncbi:MAG: hypothetical protein IPJ46_23390 [Anaerolineales bacterium]|nr:hypothetical protein [Anaerolineales bacterium]
MQKKNLNYFVSAYKELLKNGDVQVAYAELVKYVQKLKTVFAKDLSDTYSVGNVFQGYMDYTYFYLSNDFLKDKKLKLGLVFNHNHVRFEAWLLGQTKDIQENYWKLLKNTKWINGSKMPQYSIFEVILVDNPDFDDLDTLTESIKNKLVSVAEDISTSIHLAG